MFGRAAGPTHVSLCALVHHVMQKAGMAAPAGPSAVPRTLWGATGAIPHQAGGQGVPRPPMAHPMSTSAAPRTLAQHAAGQAAGAGHARGLASSSGASTGPSSSGSNGSGGGGGGGTTLLRRDASGGGGTLGPSGRRREPSAEEVRAAFSHCAHMVRQGLEEGRPPSLGSPFGAGGGVRAPTLCHSRQAGQFFLPQRGAAGDP
jgi:hypothetical protein